MQTTRSAAALELWRPHLAGAVVAGFVVAFLFPALTTTTSFTWSEALGAVALAWAASPA